MLKYRVIPCLLLRDGGLVKTRKFRNPVYVGDPINAIRIFNDKEVDELVLLDIGAAMESKDPDFGLIAEIASECFMPFAYGGGIRSMEHIAKLLRAGVEKVVMNTVVWTNPELVEQAARTFGSQAIVASIDVRRKLFGRNEVVVMAGSKGTGLDAASYAKRAEDLGVGEILLTAIDREGTMSGYDIDLLNGVCRTVGVPVVASGGAGSLAHFREAVAVGGASAIAAGSMFVFYGPHRAVLISYPPYSDLCAAFE